MITNKLKKVLETEFEGGWPNARHGVAARNTLAALATDAGDWQTRLNRCLEVGETFLKLGEVEAAAKAYRVAERLVQPGSPQRASVEAQVGRIKKMAERQDCVDQFWDGKSSSVGADASPRDAIDSLKRLEALSSEWLGSDAVAANHKPSTLNPQPRAFNPQPSRLLPLLPRATSAYASRNRSPPPPRRSATPLRFSV